MRKALLFLLLGLFGSVVGVQGQQIVPAFPVQLVPKVLNVYPHDGEAFTEGLLYHDGKLYESIGKRGASAMREIEITTGKILREVPVNRPDSELNGTTPLQDYFAEGLVLHDNKLIQLTWTEGEAFVYDLDTFEKTDTIKYTGEGWGICTDGRYFYNSDGSSYLDVRDMQTFEPIVSFAVVYLAGYSNTNQPVMQVLRPQWLNELECVDNYIYANLWQTNSIAQIDKTNGNIVGIIDCSGLLTADEVALAKTRDPGATLNGIAYNPDTQTFYITGKNWDKLFEVTFEPKPQN